LEKKIQIKFKFKLG